MSNSLFAPLQLRDLQLRNRIAVSPMCMYSSEDGFANDWHFVHLGSRAVGGAALVLTEAAAVEARGRISPQDLGIYKDEHIEGLARCVRFIKEHGAVAGIQLAHAGRKASMARPWDGGKPVPPQEGGWTPVVAPSELPFVEGWQTPSALSEEEISEVVQAFAVAAQRSLDAGFEVAEIHGAHGYLIHEFLSPLSNKRTDGYGGSLQNRMRFAVEVVKAVRAVWPERLPLLFRISSTDWTEGGWTPEESVELARVIGPLGVDLIDCSSGGNVPRASIPVGPGYQTEFAAKVRAEGGVKTGAVGEIIGAAQADHIIRSGQADMVLLAREMLRDPYWPRRAAKELGGTVDVPPQYARAW